MKKLIMIGFALCVTVPVALFYCGFIRLNYPSVLGYSVNGIDVSNWQKTIDWKTVRKDKIAFVFIKATEGSSFVDKSFAQNWEGAKNAGILRGAYHFFSFESSGETQADNFMRTVPKEKGVLPPVIDLEFYGQFKKDKPEVEKVRQELDKLVVKLEEYYGKKPIFYVMYNSYERYIKGYYDDCAIWIRNVWKRSSLHGNKAWVFWQYTDRGRVAGVNGFVDMNVYCDSYEALNLLTIQE